MKRIIWMLAGLLASLSLTAAAYWQEHVEAIPESGYYHIEVSQGIYGLGARTLRLRDAEGQEIPYFIRTSVATGERSQMEMYNVTSNVARDSVNTLVVRNTEGETSRFYLSIKRADVVMHIAIRGSYDRKQWFSVKQRSRLYNESNSVFGEVAVVDFPLGDYTYYELTVTNNSGSPLNITGVGRVAQSVIDGQYVLLPSGGFVVTTGEDKNTRISFPEMKHPYYLSKLTIGAKGKGHYSREADIVSGYVDRSFRLTSRETPVYYFDNLLISKDTYIVIRNGNNLPLEIEDVKFHGISRYLCAYLEKGMAYRIETNGEGYRHYDIQDFAKDIPASLPIVATKDLEHIEETVVEPEPRFFEKPIFMWGVIVLTGIGLLLLCVRLLKELAKRPKE